MSANTQKKANMVEGSGVFNDGVNNITLGSLSEWREHVKTASNLTQSGTLTCGLCRKVAVNVDGKPASQTTAICEDCKKSAGLS